MRILHEKFDAPAEEEAPGWDLVEFYTGRSLFVEGQIRSGGRQGAAPRKKAEGVVMGVFLIDIGQSHRVPERRRKGTARDLADDLAAAGQGDGISVPDGSAPFKRKRNEALFSDLSGVFVSHIGGRAAEHGSHARFRRGMFGIHRSPPRPAHVRQ